MRTAFSRLLLLTSALALAACGGSTTKKCNTTAECGAGQVCSVASGTCEAASTGGGGGDLGGGAGGGSGGGATGGGGGAMGGGTGGGATGGGTGGGATGGGTGGGTTSGDGETCAAPIILTPGTPLTAQTVDTAMDDFNTTVTGCTFDNGNDRVYAVTVPAGQRLTVTLTPEANATSLDAILDLVDGAANCGVACLARRDVGYDGDPETLIYTNTTAASQTLLVIVDAWEGGTGDFTLSAELSTPPADDSCAGALPTLTPGTPLTAQGLASYGNDFSGTATGCTFGSGADRAYQVTVPNGQRLTVLSTPSMLPDGGSGADLALNLVDGAANCGTACLARADNGNRGDPESMSWTNGTGASKTLIVLVDSFSGTPSEFTLAATLSTPPADDLCSGATAVTVGSPLASQSLTGYANDYEAVTGSNCASGGFGVDRAYQFSVGAGKRATVTVTPSLGTDGGASFSPSISLAAAAANCGSQCVGAANASTAPSATYFNTSGSSATVYAVVDSTSTAMPGTFTIGVTEATPAADDTCTTATTTLPVNASGLTAQTLVGFGVDYKSGSGCRGYSAGTSDRVYKVTVPAGAAADGGVLTDGGMAGQTLRVTVTPAGMIADGGYTDFVVNLICTTAAVCDSPARACVAGVDLSPSTNMGVETLSWRNTTTAAQSCLVVVGDYGRSPSPVFSISATAQ